MISSQIANERLRLVSDSRVLSNVTLTVSPGLSVTSSSNLSSTKSLKFACQIMGIFSILLSALSILNVFKY